MQLRKPCAPAADFKGVKMRKPCAPAADFKGVKTGSGTARHIDGRNFSKSRRQWFVKSPTAAAAICCARWGYINAHTYRFYISFARMLGGSSRSPVWANTSSSSNVTSARNRWLIPPPFLFLLGGSIAATIFLINYTTNINAKRICRAAPLRREVSLLELKVAHRYRPATRSMAWSTKWLQKQSNRRSNVRIQLRSNTGGARNMPNEDPMCEYN